jgi:predicted nucleic acid-binding protein
MNAVDTNVFIYALDSDAPDKQAKAQKLLDDLVAAGNSTVVPWQVVGEVLNNLRRSESAGRIPGAEVEPRFRAFFGMFPLVLPSAGLFTHYFDMRSRYSLSHWDTMLLAACKEAGVTKLYSEDMAAGMDYDGVVIVNPFQ